MSAIPNSISVFQEKSFYSDCGDLDYSNNGFDATALHEQTSNSLNNDISSNSNQLEDNANEMNQSYSNYVSARAFLWFQFPNHYWLFTHDTLQARNRRRCRALYDCNADNDDELDFKEGEIILILNERTDDENWMEGEVEGDRSRRGMFPVSFVHMITD